MPAPTPYRSSRPVRRLLFGLGSLLTILMVLWGSAQALDRLSIEEEHVVRAYSGVTAIDLRHAHGDVDLVPARGRRVEVAIDSRHGFLSGHEREDELRAGELRLRGSCDFLTIGTCEEHYRIEVPRGVTVAVRTSAGEATARGLRGDLVLRSSAGSVRALDVRGDSVELGSHAGSVSATGVRADDLELESRAGGIEVARSSGRRVLASTAAGSVDVELLTAPSSVDAESRAGAVTVVVPDVGYAVDARTRAGEERVQIRQRPAGPRTLDVESRAGDVNVLPLPADARRRRTAPARSPERDRARAGRAKSPR
ncbi:MAG TPA: DUF4097 family beta strand repeat-containing protein [Thermoleophilaceae bacterium]|nr:DUF4097 family beta strand repeat-containing protein [Thermoleophilaceae bacterium]